MLKLQISVLFNAVLFAALVLGAVAQDENKTTTATTTTTTPAPTTTPVPTTTTPVPAPTTPVPPPAPTPAPKHFPANEGKWTVENSTTNVTCIILKGAIEVVIVFVDSNNKSQSNNVDVPISAEATGNCGNGESAQSITLSWNSTLKDNSTVLNTMTFAFESNVTKTAGILSAGSEITGGKFGLQNITGVVYNATDPVHLEIVNKAAFQTPLNHSYSCLAQEALKSADGIVTVKFSDIRLEAFRETAAGHKEFSAAIDCPADDASDVVPIAVGAALAALVVIVLIAYLIGRRRSRARGYQSV